MEGDSEDAHLRPAPGFADHRLTGAEASLRPKSGQGEAVATRLPSQQPKVQARRTQRG